MNREPTFLDALAYVATKTAEYACYCVIAGALLIGTILVYAPELP